MFKEGEKMSHFQNKMVAISGVRKTLFIKAIGILLSQKPELFSRTDLNKLKQAYPVLDKDISAALTHIEEIAKHLTSFRVLWFGPKRFLWILNDFNKNYNLFSPKTLQEIQTVFSTPVYAEKLIDMAWRTTTDEERIQVVRVLDFLTENMAARVAFLTKPGYAPALIGMGCAAETEGARKEISQVAVDSGVLVEVMLSKLLEAEADEISLLRFISSVAFYNSEVKKAFNKSTRAEELLSLARRAETEEKITALADALYSIRINCPLHNIMNRGFRDGLNSPAFTDMAVTWGAIATTEKSRIAIAKLIGVLASASPVAKGAFSTEKCASMFFEMGKMVKTDEGRIEVLRSISHICEDNKPGKEVFATRGGVAVLEDIRAASPPEGVIVQLAATVGNLIYNYTYERPSTSVSSSLAELLITLGWIVTTDQGQVAVEKAVATTVKNNPASRERFCSPECIQMWMAHGTWAHTNPARLALAELIYSLVMEPSGTMQKAFSTPQVAAVLIKMGREASTGEPQVAIATTIESIALHNPVGKALFSTPSCAQMFMEMEAAQINKVVVEHTFYHYESPAATTLRRTTRKNVEKILTAVFNIIEDNPAGKKVFSTPAWTEVLAVIGSYIGFCSGEKVLKTLLSLVTDNPDYRVFQVPHIEKMIKNILVDTKKNTDMNRQHVKNLEKLSKEIKTLLTPHKKPQISR
jgi:hypothetical protein